MADRNELRREGQEHQVEGSVDELKGKVRGGVGDALDNREQHVKGRAQELKGKVQRKAGEIMEDASRRDEAV